MRGCNLMAAVLVFVAIDGAPREAAVFRRMDGDMSTTQMPPIPDNITEILGLLRNASTSKPTMMPDSMVDNDSALASRVPGQQNDFRMTRIGLAAINTAQLWTGGIIPYKLDEKFDEFARRQILQGMREWENHTCIRFIPRTTQTNYVFLISGKRCWSNAGMMGGMQELSLRVPACLYFHYDLLHELGHLIGRHHEQMRPDRDDYVTILEENIEELEKPWFARLEWGSISNFGVKYDYWSVMHYPQYAYTSNGQITIETKDPAYQWVIGNIPGLSFKDILVVNLMYQCAVQCPTNNCPEKAIQDASCKCLCYSGNPGKPVIEWDGKSNCSSPDDEHVSDSCVDYDQSCEIRADRGECRLNINYMAVNCRKACRLCGPDFECRDLGYLCIYSYLIGECESDPQQLSVLCMKTCKFCGEKEDLYPADICEDVSDVCKSIATDNGCELFTNSMLNRCPRSCRACVQHPGFVCRNWHIQCNVWKEIGQCEENPHWMSRHCPRACGLCSGGEMIDCRNYELDIECERWALQGECVLNLSWMFLHCAKACRVCGENAVCMDRSPSCPQYAVKGQCREVDQAFVISSACPVQCQSERCHDQLTVTDDCADYDPDCEKWGPMGWCTSNRNLMVRYCPRTCHVCGPDMVCKDYNDRCVPWSKSGECEANPEYMLIYCPMSCNRCIPSHMARCNHITTERCYDYLPNCEDLAREGRCRTDPEKMLADCPISCHICGSYATCQDFYPECRHWAARGECSNSPGFMEWFCRRACRCCG